MRSGRILAILAALLFRFLDLSGQEHLFDARLLTTEDGLANLMCTAVFKDHRGLLWIGTRYGLNRYDGQNYRLFTQSNNGLRQNFNIRQIREDDQGRIWIFYKNQEEDTPRVGDLEGIDILDPISERVTPFDVLFKGTAPCRESDLVLPPLQDEKNRIWLHLKDGRLFQYDRQFRQVLSTGDRTFTFMLADRADRLWIASRQKLTVYDPEGNLLDSFSVYGIPTGIFQKADDAVFLGIYLNREIKLWQYTLHGKLEPYLLTRNGQPQRLDRLAGNYFVYYSSKGYWYVSTRYQIEAFDDQGKWMFNFHSLLESNTQTSFLSYFDDNKYLWLTSSIGLIQLGIEKNKFRLIYCNKNKYSDSRGITAGDNGLVYFLCTNLFSWDPLYGKLSRLTDYNSAFAVYTDGEVVWIGDYTQKTLGSTYNLSTRQSTPYPVLTPAASLAFSVIPSPSTGMLLAGTNEGLTYIDLKEQRVVPFNRYGAFPQLMHCLVNHIYRNAEGIWLATNQGVFRLSLAEEVIRQYCTSNGELPYDNILHMHEDESGNFWLATKGGGIIRWRPAENATGHSVFKQFMTKDGLANNYTYAVYEDEFHKLWVPSDNGLMWIDKENFSVRTYHKEDGLQHNEFNQSSHFQAKDGTIYLGGLGGVISFHPRDFASELSNNTPLEVTGCFVLEGDADKMTDRTNALFERPEIRLEPGDKLFELNFKLMDFDDPKRHRYAYQIEGYSNVWTYLDQGYLRITNLPYGNYHIKIKGQNTALGWTTRELTVLVRVIKPFYLRWWFFLLIIAAVAGLFVYFIRSRTRKLRIDREKLETEVEKRTRQIELDKQTISRQAEELKQLDEAKTRFFSNITHEFRTPLTLILGPLEQLLGQGQSLESNRHLRNSLEGMMKNAQSLLELINQLMELTRLENGRMQVEVKQCNLITYTAELLQRFTPLATRGKIDLKLNSSVWELHVAFDKNVWDKTFNNLLSNAIKFTPEGGRVSIFVDRRIVGNRPMLYLKVEDTGIGIREQDQALIFNRFYQVDDSSTRLYSGTGIGLAIVRELVEKSGGTIRLSSRIHQGSTFEVWVPELPAGTAVSEPVHPGSLPTALEFDNLPAEQLMTSISSGPAPGKNRLKLLLIEDNADMRNYVRQCLEESDYEILEASDGLNGLQIARQVIPDLIISDVMMPGKNGFEVIREIRSHLATSHIPVVLLTARSSLESRLEGLARGADVYLTKPFSMQELSLQVKNLIAMRVLLQERYRAGSASGNQSEFQEEDLFITKLSDFIRANLSNPDIDVEHISRHFGISRTQFYRKLDALTGQPIARFIRSVRLDAAAEMLRKGQMNIAEVAYASGFSSPSHFSRVFRQEYGTSPSEWT